MAYLRHLLVLTLCVLTACASADVSVGYITQDRPRSSSVDAAVEAALRNVTVGGEGRVLPLLREVPRKDPLAAAAAVCSLADEGVAAIVDGGHSSGLCHTYGLPCLSVRTPAGKPGSEHEALTIRMEPEKNTITEALAGMLREMRWFTFSLVYDNMDHLGLLEPVLTDPAFRVTLVKIQAKHSYMAAAQALDQTRGSRVVLALEAPHLRGLLSTCSATVTRPLQVLVATAHTQLQDLQTASSKLPLMGVRVGGGPPSHNPPHHGIDLQEALALDAVEAVRRALQGRAEGDRALRAQAGLCRLKQTWDQGTDFFTALTQVDFEGHSGHVSFDAEGFRTDFSLSIVSFSDGVASEVMRWSPSRGPETPPASPAADVPHTPSRRPRDLRTLTGGRTPTLRVAAVLSAPYVMHKEQEGNDTEELFGNDRFEGFSVDLMDEIAQEIGFNYILDINPFYGTKDPQTGEFNGVIGDLVNQRVDAVIGDITVNEARESVVDFTDPWYSFGIGLMVYHTGPKTTGPLFGFLSIFSAELWWVLLAAALGTAVFLFFLSRVSPYERVGSLDQEPQTWTPFTFCYSIWFAFGTLFRQFIYFQPRAPSTRVLTLVWWLLVIVVAAHYVANLASFFTLRGLRSVGTIKSVYDLPEQNQITYTSLYGGSTWAFFRDAQSESLQRVYSAMYNRASERRILSSAQGIEEVLQSEGSFGFLMEEPSLEYTTERNCDLKQLGGTVGSRDFAIALQQDSPYLDYFNDALYAIRESGQLQALRDLWWRRRRGGGQCSSRFLAAEPSAVTPEVELEDLAGPLLLLGAGAALALVLALLECCYYAASSAGAKGSDVGSEMGQQFSQTFTTSPSSHLPLARQAKL